MQDRKQDMFKAGTKRLKAGTKRLKAGTKRFATKHVPRVMSHKT